MGNGWDCGNTQNNCDLFLQTHSKFDSSTLRFETPKNIFHWNRKLKMYNFNKKRKNL